MKSCHFPAKYFLTTLLTILSWNEFQQSREEFRESQERFRKSQEIDKAGQISSRFSQAIKLLSEEKTTSNTGAIYALKHIATESPDDYLQKKMGQVESAD